MATSIHTGTACLLASKKAAFRHVLGLTHQGYRPGRAITARQMCVAAGLRGQEALLAGVEADYRRDVARVLELAGRATSRFELVHSDFLTPPVVSASLDLLQQMANTHAVAWGGYQQAERVRLTLGPEELTSIFLEDPGALANVAAIQVQGNFMFDKATHRDFLGAALGTGVDRARVGDILLMGEMGAQLLVDPELIEHFQLTLTKVRSVPVKSSPIPLAELKVSPPRVEEIKSVEASMRLDAVASAGFKMSRSKMLDRIKGGDVRVNWKVVEKPSVEVKAGDNITCAGKGRLELRAVQVTKKDRFAVEMVRFV